MKRLSLCLASAPEPGYVFSLRQFCVAWRNNGSDPFWGTTMVQVFLRSNSGHLASFSAASEFELNVPPSIMKLNTRRS
jgi:hypothetical protein